MKSKRHPDWNQIFWGGRVRPLFQSDVIDIAQSVAKSETSYYGSMVSSSVTYHYPILDGGVRERRGFFGPTCGMTISGEKCLQYILYRLGFDPKELIPDAPIIYSERELRREVEADAATSKLRST